MYEKMIERISCFLENLDNSPSFEKSEYLGGYLAVIDRHDGRIIRKKRIGYPAKDIQKYHSLVLKEARLLIDQKEINSYKISKDKNSNAIVAGETILSISGNFSKEVAEAILIAATNDEDADNYRVWIKNKLGEYFVRTIVARIHEKRGNNYMEFLMSK